MADKHFGVAEFTQEMINTFSSLTNFHYPAVNKTSVLFKIEMIEVSSVKTGESHM